VPQYRPNRQAHLINLKSKVRQLSQQPRRRLQLQRTALLDRALRRVARQHRTVTCLVHRTLRRRRVRRFRRIRLVLKAHLEQRPLRVRRMHLIRRPRLRKRHPARRTRLVQTQRLDPRLSLVLKARLVRRLPPNRRNRLIRKNGHPSSEPTASTRRLVAPGYEPRRLGGGRLNLRYWLRAFISYSCPTAHDMSVASRQCAGSFRPGLFKIDHSYAWV
jgi:hypothetical protein